MKIGNKTFTVIAILAISSFIFVQDGRSIWQNGTVKFLEPIDTVSVLATKTNVTAIIKQDYIDTTTWDATKSYVTSSISSKQANSDTTTWDATKTNVAAKADTGITFSAGTGISATGLGSLGANRTINMTTPVATANLGSSYADKGRSLMGDNTWAIATQQMSRHAEVATRAASTTLVLTMSPSVTSDATASSADVATGSDKGCYVKFTTGSTSGNTSGERGGYTDWYPGWCPELRFKLRTDTAVTNIRIWAGSFSKTPDSSATYTMRCAAFRFDTGVDGTYWYACTSNNSGASLTATQTTLTCNINTAYEFGIRWNSTEDTIFFYGASNGAALTQLAAITTTLPSASSYQGHAIRVTTLTNISRAVSFGHFMWTW